MATACLEVSPNDAVLPDGWSWIPLGSLGTWKGGGTPSKANEDFWTNGTVPWVSPKDMKYDVIRDAIDWITEEAVCSSATNMLPTGSVLLVTRSGILEHSLPVGVAALPVSVNQDLKAIIPNERITSDYLAWALRSFAHDILLKCRKAGTTVASLEMARLLKYEIPVAPVDEQPAIIAQLESRLSRLDKAVADLRSAETKLKRHRAATLAAATSGRLVPTEAALAQQQGRAYEPASVLLQRILTERRRRWEADQLAAFARKGTTPRDDRWKAKYQEPVAPDTTNLPELPEGWVWASGAQLFSWSSGNGLTQKQIKGGPIPVYGGNGINGYHDEIVTELPTLVVGRVGAQCGNVYVTDGPAWITDNAIYATECPSDISLGYAKMVFTAAQLNKRSAGSGQPFVNQRMLNETVIALPPLIEQRRVLEEHDRQTSGADSISLCSQQSERRSQSLRSAILDRKSVV